MNELTTQHAYRDLAANAALRTAATSWEDAAGAIDAALQASAEIHSEAIKYYVGEGKPNDMLAKEALRVGALSLEAAATLALVDQAADPADTIESQRRRFQDLLASRLPDLGGPPSSYRAGRLLLFLARYLGGGQAHSRRAEHDPVSRSFAVDDLLEAAGFAWLLADLIAHAGDGR